MYSSWFAACAPVCNPADTFSPEEMLMKRFHVHLHVDDLSQSIRFYSTLFAAEPTVVQDDYAKWMLDDPRVNFAISELLGELSVSRISAFRPRTKRNSPRSASALCVPNVRGSRRRAPSAATPDLTSSGSPTRRVCRGKPSSLW